MVMPPSTASIMGSLPPGKAGVGSAVNDVTREMGGAVGVAVIGSLFLSGYRHGVAPVVKLLPEPAAEAAKSGLGGALAVAQRIPGEGGKALADAASQAFVDGMGRGFLAGSLIALVGVGLVLKFLPARPVNVAHQHDERELDAFDDDAPAAVG